MLPCRFEMVTPACCNALLKYTVNLPVVGLGLMDSTAW